MRRTVGVTVWGGAEGEGRRAARWSMRSRAGGLAGARPSQSGGLGVGGPATPPPVGSPHDRRNGLGRDGQLARRPATHRALVSPISSSNTNQMFGYFRNK